MSESNQKYGELLDRVIKAYDIRGLVEDEITPDFTFTLGVAFGKFLELEREPATVVVGEDMRPSSPELASAFSDGVMSVGLDVIRMGLASTDQLYFASGKLNLPGAMFTASHNPAEYNGIKLCKSGARPIGQDSGLRWIKNAMLQGSPIQNRIVGSEKSEVLLHQYVDHLFTLFDVNVFSGLYKNRKLKIVVDAGNGMGGHTAPAVFSRVNCELIPLYFELDGSFPNHEANPIDPKNLRDLQKLVRRSGADLGLAFDGDADRCFLIDENGALVSPSAITALIAKRELEKHPKSAIIYNLICSRIVPEVIEAAGGRPIKSRVGHSFIKTLMAENDAVFGGEHSGHFYFRDFWRADSGMLAALHLLAALLESQESLSDLMAPYHRYSLSGELNTRVTSGASALAALRSHYETHPQVKEFEELDGLTVIADDWSFNLRPSNTEPLLRLNVEARDEEIMSSIRDEVLALIARQ
jgi:phosphomannomutase